MVLHVSKILPSSKEPQYLRATPTRTPQKIATKHEDSSVLMLSTVLGFYKQP